MLLLCAKVKFKQILRDRVHLCDFQDKDRYVLTCMGSEIGLTGLVWPDLVCG